MVDVISSAFTVWRPNIPESIDGKPLATHLGDLFIAFPTDRLPSNSLVAMSMKPTIVLAMVIFYLNSKGPLKDLCGMLKITGKSIYFRTVVAIHNLFLAIFSFLVVIHTWPIVVQHLNNYGINATYCDQEGTLWSSGFGAWATIFYISKYYEFIDTWVLVIKGKEPSFLQTYHHAGIVLTMWGGVASQSAWLVWVVLLNSIIHTLMYIYFFIKTIWPKTVIKSAKYLTSLQIAQFVTGITGTLGVVYMGDSCDTTSSRFVLLCLQAYGVGLIILFSQFAAKKYKKA